MKITTSLFSSFVNNKQDYCNSLHILITKRQSMALNIVCQRLPSLHSNSHQKGLKLHNLRYKASTLTNRPQCSNYDGFEKDVQMDDTYKSSQAAEHKDYWAGWFNTRTESSLKYVNKESLPPHKNLECYSFHNRMMSFLQQALYK